MSQRDYPTSEALLADIHAAATTDNSHADSRVARRPADDRLCPACKTLTMQLRHPNTEVKFLQCSTCAIAVALWRPV